MSASVIRIFYSIQNASKYTNKINSILEKHEGEWHSEKEEKNLKLKLLLKQTAQIKKIQCKLSNIDMISFVFKNQNKEVDEKMKLLSKNQKSGSDIFSIDVDMTEIVDTIDIQFHAYKDKILKISYVGLFGVADGEYEKKNDEIPLQQKENKNDNEIQVEEQQNIEEITKKDEKIESETSKKNSSRSRKKTKRENEEQNQLTSESEKQNDEKKEGEEQTKYTIQKVKKKQLYIFKHITRDWLLEQRKMQQSMSVRQQHQLSRKINKKCLKGLIFCCVNLSKNQKAEITRLGTELGGIFREDVKENSIVITKKIEGDRIGIIRLKNNITFVTPNYIIDCYEQKTKLPLNNFYPPEGKFF